MAASTSTPKPDDSEDTPFYKQTWFIFSVGFVVFLIIAFVGYRMYQNSQKKKSALSDTLASDPAPASESSEPSSNVNVSTGTGAQPGNVAMLTNRMNQKIHEAQQEIEMKQIQGDIVSNATAIQNLAEQNKKCVEDCREVRNLVMAMKRGRTSTPNWIV